MVRRSIDSEVKLWNVQEGQVLRTYGGHSCHKKFTGLTFSNDFISCGRDRSIIGVHWLLKCVSSLFIGSEDNVYSKQVSKPMLKFTFNTPSNLLVRSHLV